MHVCDFGLKISNTVLFTLIGYKFKRNALILLELFLEDFGKFFQCINFILMHPSMQVYTFQE